MFSIDLPIIIKMSEDLLLLFWLKLFDLEMEVVVLDWPSWTRSCFLAGLLLMLQRLPFKPSQYLAGVLGILNEDGGTEAVTIWLACELAPKLLSGCSSDLVLTPLDWFSNGLPSLSYTCDWPPLWQEEAGEWFEYSQSLKNKKIFEQI